MDISRRSFLIGTAAALAAASVPAVAGLNDAISPTPGVYRHGWRAVGGPGRYTFSMCYKLVDAKHFRVLVEGEVAQSSDWDLGEGWRRRVVTFVLGDDAPLRIDFEIDGILQNNCLYGAQLETGELADPYFSTPSNNYRVEKSGPTNLLLYSEDFGRLGVQE